jgi:hypothetical protein
VRHGDGNRDRGGFAAIHRTDSSALSVTQECEGKLEIRCKESAPQRNSEAYSEFGLGLLLRLPDFWLWLLREAILDCPDVCVGHATFFEVVLPT